MKLSKLLTLCALGVGLLTVTTTSPALAKKGARTTRQGANANSLGLSANQKAQLKPLRKESKAQIQAVKADTTLSKKERHSRIKAVRADRRAKLSAILTTEQQQKLDARRAQKRAGKRAAKA